MFEKYSRQSPTALHPISLKFAFEKPAHIIATFFGTGVLRPASGTFGTLAAWLLYLALSPYLGPIFWVCAIVIAFFAGVWACEITCKDIGVHDHTSTVIDEVFAIWIVLLTVPATLPWQIAAFVAFRFFDIVKIPPTSWIDRNMENGWGIMLDDLAAAIQAIIVLWLAHLVI